MSKNFRFKRIFLWAIWIGAGFIGICVCFLLFSPAVRPIFFPDYDDYDKDYYESQSKENNLTFDELNQAIKIEIIFPVFTGGILTDETKTIDDVKKIGTLRQFIQEYPNAWAKWQPYTGVPENEMISIEFYDRRGSKVGLCRVGLHRLVYDNLYWRYVEDKEFVPLLEELGIKNRYLALGRES